METMRRKTDSLGLVEVLADKLWGAQTQRSLWTLLPWIVVAIGAAVSLGASPADAPFLAENDAAMKKMMAAMHVAPTGDADADFVATMVPHHQGAIDMAQAELRYGRNERLRRLAQEIVVVQAQEIAVMRQALAEEHSK